MSRYSIILAAVALMLLSATLCLGAGEGHGNDVSGLVEQLGSPSTSYAATKRLVEIEQPAIEELGKALDRKGNSDLKIAAVKTLLEIAKPECAEPIKNGLGDPDWQVRTEAAEGLFKLWQKHIIDKEVLWRPCSKLLFDEESAPRVIAARELYYMDREKCVPLLLDTLDREFKMPRKKRGSYKYPETMKFWGEDDTISACNRWIIMAPKTSAPVIASRLGKSTRDLDYCLAFLLLRHEYKPVYADLLIEGATKCSSASVRINIIADIWNVDDPRVDGILKNALKDPYTVVTPGCAGGETIYPFRDRAERSLMKIEAKKKGIDPHSEEYRKQEDAAMSSHNQQEQKH